MFLKYSLFLKNTYPDADAAIEVESSPSTMRRCRRRRDGRRAFPKQPLSRLVVVWIEPWRRRSSSVETRRWRQSRVIVSNDDCLTLRDHHARKREEDRGYNHFLTIIVGYNHARKREEDRGHKEGRRDEGQAYSNYPVPVFLQIRV